MCNNIFNTHMHCGVAASTLTTITKQLRMMGVAYTRKMKNPEESKYWSPANLLQVVEDGAGCWVPKTIAHTCMYYST